MFASYRHSTTASGELPQGMSMVLSISNYREELQVIAKEFFTVMLSTSGARGCPVAGKNELCNHAHAELSLVNRPSRQERHAILGFNEQNRDGGFLISALACKSAETPDGLQTPSGMCMQVTPSLLPRRI
jgi:hypothetical protein